MAPEEKVGARSARKATFAHVGLPVPDVSRDRGDDCDDLLLGVYSREAVAAPTGLDQHRRDTAGLRSALSLG